MAPGLCICNSAARHQPTPPRALSTPTPKLNSTNPRPRARRSQKERARIVKETTPLVLQRPLKLCNFVDWKSFKLVGRHRPMGAWQAGVCVVMVKGGGRAQAVRCS